MATPKARLNQLYNEPDGQPLYSTFVGVPPGYKAQSTDPYATFYCKVQLPNGVVVYSDACRRKKEAEQDAARKALQEIGSPFELRDFSIPAKSHHDVLLDIKQRIENDFSDEYVLHYKPLMEHFRAAIVRRGQTHAPIPATVFASLDNKIISLCKALYNMTDANPMRASALVSEAVKESSMLKCDDNLWISRVEPFPADFKTELLTEPDHQAKRIQFDAIYIPASLENPEPIEIVVEPYEYYMDVLARKLSVKDGAHVLISKPITKAPPGTRLFWGLPEVSPRSTIKNSRASTFTTYPVYGDAILAAVGSTWQSDGQLSYDNVSLPCYYRLDLGKRPNGCYKMSRGAILTAELSSTYTSKSRWRGATPRSILNEYTHQYHLPTPTFCTYSVGGTEEYERHARMTDASDRFSDANSTQGPFMCKLKMILKEKEREFESEKSYRNRYDAMQSACLRALYYLDPTILMPEEESDAEEDGKRPFPDFVSEGEFKDERPSIGSMVHVDYCAKLTVGKSDLIAEEQTDFDFELGSGAVLGRLDACVAKMCAGQTARFFAPMPPFNLLLATEKVDPALINKISEGTEAWFEYTVTLQKCVEASETRMESAVFSPPLSRQRIDYALQLARDFEATSVIDLGCGSGSFLEAAVEQLPALEKLVGVDTSIKSLNRASKAIKSKLGKLSEEHSLRSVALYEGSISEPDRDLRDFDFAVCLEVIEHMDPEPLSKFGKSIMGIMAPKKLLVSTPNIEYNTILHGLRDKEEASSKGDADDSSTVRFRNEDHRFEWNRKEFSEWATEQANEHGYKVDFWGVGGSWGEEPGFASQMAIFTRDRDISSELSPTEEWRTNSSESESSSTSSESGEAPTENSDSDMCELSEGQSSTCTGATSYTRETSIPSDSEEPSSDSCEQEEEVEGEETSGEVSETSYCARYEWNKSAHPF